MSTQLPRTARVVIGDAPLGVTEVVAVARGHAPVVISEPAWQRVRAACSVVTALARDPVAHYGISTGFRALATTTWPSSMPRTTCT